MWDFEHEPEAARLAERYLISRVMPSQCAAQLGSGEADIGLVPVAAYAATPGLAILPGCAIASLDRVRSILLVVQAARGVKAAQTIAADTSSQTSFAYTQILFRKYWNASARFVPHAPDLDAMLRVADAALLIGDPALLALEDRAAREQRTGQQLEYLDLAHEWRLLTGTAWVSAFWAVRPRAVEECGLSPLQVSRDFLNSRDHGLAHIDDLVTEWSARIAVPAATIRTYLTQNIHYRLDDACVTGLELFYRYAAETGTLPPAPALKML